MRVYSIDRQLALLMVSPGERRFIPKRSIPSSGMVGSLNPCLDGYVLIVNMEMGHAILGRADGEVTFMPTGYPECV